MAIRQDGKQNIIVAGFSYGQGSSREHAAICPMFLGTGSHRQIFLKEFTPTNLINFGILPLTFCVESDYDRIDQEDDLEINDTKRIIAGDEKFLSATEPRVRHFMSPVFYPKGQKQIILRGSAQRRRLKNQFPRPSET
jgi:aconitate hydratase